MEPTNARRLGPARVVALVLIGLGIFGLAYLRFAPDSSSVSVPKGAKAGDLELHDCKYATEAGSYAADCGTLVVPENRAGPQSRLIALPVTRIRARSVHPAEPVFRLAGGPGITNMKFAEASRIAGDHDVVLVGYRGVNGSSRLDCPQVVSALKHSTDFLAKKSLNAYNEGFRSCAARLEVDGVDLAGYTIPERVDDLEAARVAFGYERIDLVSESAGTRTAMIYAWRHPKSIHRSVMIGANPPGHFVADSRTTDEQIARYAALCAADDGCSSRTHDLSASMASTSADMPDHWLVLPIKTGTVQIALHFGLADTTEEAAPLSAPMMLQAWQSTAHGDASAFWMQSLMGDIAFPTAFVWGDLMSVGRADRAVVERHFASEHKGGIDGDAVNTFLFGGGGALRAWPAAPNDDRYSRVQPSNVETLLVGGALDVQTPPQFATRELLPQLRNGHQLVLPGFGHSGDFWTYQPEASTRLLNAFFASGKVDDSLYTEQKVDFRPEVSQTALAKGIFGAMLGFAILAVLSLVWMCCRAGKLGRKRSAFLRSVYPVVLGLGGWFAGVLIVLPTMPGVPLDDELLGVLGIGLPIGLGIYFAWVRSDRPAKARTIGLVAGICGALIGAWFGFSATAGLVAIFTTILGATAGANLALVGLDIAWARRAVSRHTAEPVVEPRLVTG